MIHRLSIDARAESIDRRVYDGGAQSIDNLSTSHPNLSIRCPKSWVYDDPSPGDPDSIERGGNLVDPLGVPRCNGDAMLDARCHDCAPPKHGVLIT